MEYLSRLLGRYTGCTLIHSFRCTATRLISRWHERESERDVHLQLWKKKIASWSELLILMPIMVAVAALYAPGKVVPAGPTYSPYGGLVEVLLDPPEDFPYEELGIISSSGGMIHKWTDMVAAMQKEAAKHGANAIIIRSSAETTDSAGSYNRQLGQHDGTYPRKDVIGVAIRISGQQAGRK